MKTLIKKFIPSFLLDWYHLGLSFLGAVLYGFPSRLRQGFPLRPSGFGGQVGGQARQMIVIGVTGTKGKSTVVEFCHRIFSEALRQAQGKQVGVASLSSIRFKINDKERPNLLKMTMPGRFKIQKFLRQAKNAGCQYVILEATSEGILQHRHRFINFNTAVFTNLAPEHIEHHGSFENYRAAKGKLFEAAKDIHIVNIDDENAKYFLQFPANKKYTYGLNQGDISNKNLHLNLRLLGEFNIYNALAAIGVGLSQGIDFDVCKKALEKIEGLPGRMEVVIEKPFRVIVDYAHTPDALRKVYETLLNSKFKNQNSKLICVLGACGGGRDKWKRPVLGEIAARYCDKIILTNEDPYDENPLKIIEDIESGFSQIPNPPASTRRRSEAGKSQIANYEKILDRREAIKKALSLANSGDIVIITGKGCEPWMCVAQGKKIPWDEREMVREEFKKLGNR